MKMKIFLPLILVLVSFANGKSKYYLYCHSKHITKQIDDRCLLLTVSFYFVLDIVRDFDSISKRQGRSIAQGITSDNMSSTIMIGMLKPKGTMRPRCKWIYSTSLKRFVCQKDSDSNTILKRQGRSTTFTTNISAGSASGNFYSTVSFICQIIQQYYFIFFLLYFQAPIKRVIPNGFMRPRCQWFYSRSLRRFVCRRLKRVYY